MRSSAILLPRGIGDVFGLSTSLTIVLLIVVPVLIVTSTGLLIFYYIKSRRRAAHTRNASKSSNLTTSTDTDQEIGLTHPTSSFRPGTGGSQFRPGTGGSQSTIRAMPIAHDRRVVAGHVKGAGSEVFDIHQYESERANQRNRDMVLPSPPASPVFNSSSRDNRPLPPSFSPLDMISRTDYNRSKFTPAEVSFPTPPTRVSPTPMRGPAGRPGHTNSPRSLSVFPPIAYRNSMQSSTHGSSPSPPLLTPISSLHSPKLPPPRPRNHVRHPSIGNSNMPIAPILISDTSLSKGGLPTLDEGYSTPDSESRTLDYQRHNTPEYDQNHDLGYVKRWVEKPTNSWVH
jgi:hypothetical protein